MAWVSPTGHNDPDGKWSYESDAYDDDTGSSADNTAASYDHYLELTIAEILCDRVRIYAEDTTGVPSYDPDLDIDVYYGDDWHNIWNSGDGTIPRNTWVEKPIGSSQLVTKARIKSNTSDRALRLYEFDFGEALNVETDACSNPTPSSLQANGDITNEGTETVTRRGFHYSKVFDGFEWGSDTDPLDDSGGVIDWTIEVAGTSKAEIDTAQHYSGTRSARLYRDGTNNVYAQFPQAALTSTQVIGFRARKDETSQFHVQYGDGTYCIKVRVKEDETVWYYDGVWKNTGATVSVSIWFLLSIKNVNWVAGTYDIYLNGTLIKSGATMQSSSDISGAIRFYNVLGTSEVWLDEVAVWDVEDEDGSYGEGEYDLEITGLDPVTTYYVQAFAENADGIAYGNVVTCGTTVVIEGSSEFSGVGLITSQSLLVIPVQSEFSGVGTIISASLVNVLGSGEFSGIGTIDSSSYLFIVGQGQVLGEGIITSNAHLFISGQGQILGEGTIISSGLLDIFGGSEFSGKGIITSNAYLVISGSGEILGIGIILSNGLLATFEIDVPISQIPIERVILGRIPVKRLSSSRLSAKRVVVSRLGTKRVPISRMPIERVPESPMPLRRRLDGD